MITLSSCSTIMNMRVENWAKDHIDKIYNNGTMGHICSPNMVDRKNTSIYLFREINKNPFVKYPQYESIFCGNSYMGNMEGYGINEITEKVFSLYGGKCQGSCRFFVRIMIFFYSYPSLVIQFPSCPNLGFYSSIY